MSETNAAQMHAVQAPSRRNTAGMLLRIGRIILGAVFVYAAYTKLRNPWPLFAMSIESYHMLPTWISELIARSLPWFELLLGVLLIIGVGLRWVAAAASLMLISFFTVMLRAQAKGLTIDCGCFGVGEQLGPKTLIRDGLLVALAIAVTVGAFLARRQRSSGAAAAARPV
jgi:uncharacterized membrane protein YphA (DoxX/SURF4 family)